MQNISMLVTKWSIQGDESSVTLVAVFIFEMNQKLKQVFKVYGAVATFQQVEIEISTYCR